MDQASTHSPDGRAATASATPASAPTWDSYYREASRRRRAAGGGRNLRDEKRRRRWRERLTVGVSALLVGVMTLVFYLVLR
jgi:hypothetical protein